MTRRLAVAVACELVIALLWVRMVWALLRSGSGDVQIDGFQPEKLL